MLHLLPIWVRTRPTNWERIAQSPRLGLNKSFPTLSFLLWRPWCLGKKVQGRLHKRTLSTEWRRIDLSCVENWVGFFDYSQLEVPRFNPNRSLDSEQISLVCWADGWLWVRRRSELRRKRTKYKMPTRKWKMAGSYLLHNELHYNGLMTDWGLRTRAIRFAISNPMERGNCIWRMARCLCPTTAICWCKRNSVYFTLRTLLIDRRLTCMWKIISGKVQQLTFAFNKKKAKEDKHPLIDRNNRYVTGKYEEIVVSLLKKTLLWV